MSVSSVSNNTTTGTSSNSAGASSGTNNFASLTANDFLKMLITELQNQDPTQPVSNTELLQQLSQMQALQSNVELNTTLSNFAANEQVSSGAAFLGKVITGNDSNQNPVTGIADSVFLQNGTLMVGVGSSSVAINNITGVALAPQSSTTPQSNGQTN